ncbi:class I SAM-dependent methyltransferase [Streptomyces sp. NBC_01723]|uniref:class I SAM-dependent methyltransferase n=1 Tax=Streptomyces sp. NBC_01723 TaxID=2975921 RepID=UPI002E349AE2|nr:methyltransferase domain-containing protein [Streptomyces sp. NBC_01723]
MNEPSAAVDRWDRHYAEAGPDRPRGNPWRLVDAAEIQALAVHATPSQAGERALDVGCGVGDLTATLHQLGYQADGVDLSPTAINQARTHHPECQFACTDISSLPDGPAYTLIVTRLVFPFIDQAAFLDQTRRLLTGRGRLLVLDYLATDLRAQARGIGLTDQHLAALTAWSSHITRYTSQSLRGWLGTPKEAP